ncbi:Lactose permease [Vanrija pseudolonga]|uniref:Lactose permease n=1 Tax=Vanrija pseudolonga TaxID=143232 RepID=A0AAF1BGN6_9TREE|nr:Lactose permease [Vanrija pseudolonga]
MGVPGGATSAGVSTQLMTVIGGRDTRWYKGSLLKLNLLIFIVLIASMTNGYDGSMMNGLQALDNWKEYFHHPEEKPTLFGVFNAIQNIGNILGLPFAPYVSDLLGRRNALILACTIMIVATIIQTAAKNVGMFIAARGLIGFGLSFANIAAPVLITELAFPTQRGPITSLYNSCWFLGAIVAAWTTYGTFRIQNTWSWRIPSLLQGLPAVVQLGLIWLIPESPRWLVAHGHDDKAIAFLTKYHCNGDANDPLIQFEYNEIKETIRMDNEAKNSTSWKSLFTEKANLRRMRIIIAIAFFSQWVGNGLISYYLTLLLKGVGITSEGDQTLINGILQIWNYAWAIGGALVVDRVGRRFLFLASMTGMLVSFVAWTICSATYAKSSVFDPACIAENKGKSNNCVAIKANKGAGYAVIVFIFTFFASYSIALTPLLISYTVEILPYRIRSKGLMVLSLTISAALVFNQYVNPIALDALGWKYYIVFCCFLGFAWVYCYLFVIETRGPNGPLPLEEVSSVFEGPGYYGFQKRPHQNNIDDENPDLDVKDVKEHVEHK